MELNFVEKMTESRNKSQSGETGVCIFHVVGLSRSRYFEMKTLVILIYIIILNMT